MQDSSGMLLLGVTALANSVGAQSPPTPPRDYPELSSLRPNCQAVTEVPLYFRAVKSVPHPSLPGETSSVSAANGILYQMSGSTEIGADDQTRTLNPGEEGSFIAAGKQVMLAGGSGVPSTFLHFVLAPATDLNRSAETAPATVTELYRTPTAVPRPQTGHAYDLNLSAGYFSGADAIQPTAPSLRCSPVLHCVGNGDEHGGRQDGGEGTRFIDLRKAVQTSCINEGNPGNDEPNSPSWLSTSTRRVLPLCFLAHRQHPQVDVSSLPGFPPLMRSGNS